MLAFVGMPVVKSADESKWREMMNAALLTCLKMGAGKSNPRNSVSTSIQYIPFL